MKIFTRANVHFFTNIPCEMRFLGMCGEFFIRCSPHENQDLSVWVILTPKHVNFISFIFSSVFYVMQMLCENLVMQCTYMLIRI